VVRTGFPAIQVAGTNRSAEMPARILIADDNCVARTTIRSFLRWHSFQICGEARCGKEAVAKLRELTPDIVLLGINMPDTNSIRTAYEILRVSRRSKVVFLSLHDTPGTMKAARMWADGFVTKSAAGLN
jgi:DNA-binding NarL/FixJ family response regulator